MFSTSSVVQVLLVQPCLTDAEYLEEFDMLGMHLPVKNMLKVNSHLSQFTA